MSMKREIRIIVMLMSLCVAGMSVIKLCDYLSGCAESVEVSEVQWGLIPSAWCAGSRGALTEEW
jgi:hypothetical protein